MLETRLLVLLPAAACFASFSWGTLRHFRSIGSVPRGMRLIEAISLAMMAVFAWLVLAYPPSRLWPAAPVLCLASLALFAWTVRATRDSDFALAFSGAQPPTVLMHGPFRYMRHPFYTSYLIFWLSTCIATMSSLSWIGLVMLATCYVAAAREEERIMLGSRLSNEYARYASRTGMFLPRLHGRALNVLSKDLET